MRKLLAVVALFVAILGGLFYLSGLGGIFYSPQAGLDPTSPVERLSALHFPTVNHYGKQDPLYAIAFKDRGNGTADLEGPMSVLQARSLAATHKGYEVYVENTDEYDDTILAYWPDNRPWPVVGHEPVSVPGSGMEFKVKPLANR